MKNIWQSGVIFAAIGFLANLIYYVFQIVISRQFEKAPGEFGLMNNTITFATYLGLPLAIATQAVTHYIARFHFSGDDARLHGLLAGCRKFLFHMTFAGSILAVVLVKPLGDYFHISRIGLTVIALVCVLGGLWASYVTALCQGLGWFKRLALIGLLAAIARLSFGWPTTKIWPVAEWGVLASVVMLLPNLILLFWKKEFPRRTDTAISPWNSEFIQFLVVSAACVIGSSLFNQWDTMVSQLHFSAADRDAYSAAEKLAVALPTGVGPLLIVLFTHRSSRRHGDALHEQLKFVGLYAGGLIFGAICLYALRGFCLQLLHRNSPEAAGMVGRLSVTMIFVGLLQAIGTWALASRWIKISLLYGGLGLAYWLTLLFLGKSPAELLRVMPIAAGIAFAALFLAWLIALRSHKISAPAQS
jgi:hypothetical protein